MSMDKLGTWLKDMTLRDTEAERIVNTDEPQQQDRPISEDEIKGAEVRSRREDKLEHTLVLNTQEEFWGKQEDMRRKHYNALRKLLPVIQKMQEGQNTSSKELFFQHLKDAFAILNMNRSLPVPEYVTINVLGRAERFIVEVLRVHTTAHHQMMLD